MRRYSWPCHVYLDVAHGRSDRQIGDDPPSSVPNVLVRQPPPVTPCPQAAGKAAHRLIHFDMPWSLMVFQQRNGRVDRYGQPRTPQIVYLVTKSANETIRGDTRVLEVLQRKDEQAYQNVGDPSAFMNKHDIREEEKVTEQAIADGETASYSSTNGSASPSAARDSCRWRRSTR